MKKPSVKVQMAETPEELPSPDQILAPLTDSLTDPERAEIDALLANNDSRATATNHTHPLTDGAPVPGLTTYQSRIRIVEAWRYPGSFKDAPGFIDRNWAAYAGYDDERKIEAGPCLRLPANTPTGEKLARKGDYVVRQEVSLAAGVDGDVEVDVWPAEQFERLFLPVYAGKEGHEKPHRPFNPPESPMPHDLPPEVAPEGVGDAAAGAGLPLKADGTGGGAL